MTISKIATLGRLRKLSRSTSLIIQATVVAVAMLLPMLGAQASAAQLTTRSVAISTSKISAAGVSMVFTYTPSAATTLGIVYSFCTTPLGTCTAPTGTGGVFTGATHTGQTGWGTNATAFAPRSGADLGACLTTSGAAYTSCFLRGSGTANTVTPVTHTIAGITFPNAKQSVYVRIALFSDASYATNVDSGNVAFAITDALNVSGRVQERLNFCVASIDVVAAMPANVAACVALASNAIDIGIVDNGSALNAVSPVVNSGTNGANGKYGILQIDTNGTLGTAVSYVPVPDTGSPNQQRNFRQTGLACNAVNTTLTDPCFQPSSTSGAVLATNTEAFGMQIPCTAEPGVTTSLRTAGGAAVNAAYSNTDANIVPTANCQALSVSAGFDAGIKFAWDDSGASPNLITSSAAAIDNEIIKIRFGAEATSTTPVGTYTVSTNFVATPIF